MTRIINKGQRPSHLTLKLIKPDIELANAHKLRGFACFIQNKLAITTVIREIDHYLAGVERPIRNRGLEVIDRGERINIIKVAVAVKIDIIDRTNEKNIFLVIALIQQGVIGILTHLDRGRPKCVALIRAATRDDDRFRSSSR